MTYNEAKDVCNSHLLPKISELFGLADYKMKLLNSDGGCNVVYRCDKADAHSLIVRVSFLPSRNCEDLLGESEYIRYLHERGGNVANILDSINGNLVEELVYDGHSFFVCMFEYAKGKRFVDNHYKYREGVSIDEYYYNCGKTLGKIHQLSKEYVPTYKRYSFSDKYNAEYINEIIPNSLPLLKTRMLELLNDLEKLERDKESYGMVHLDYCDGNYHIDFSNGEITVYDFDNSCFCWYMYDIADLWRNGMGWIINETDVEKRRSFMTDSYFKMAIEGYKSETAVDDRLLEQLPLFIKATYLESIIDAFEDADRNGYEMEYDEELAYYIKCMEDDIPYYGFFSDIYMPDSPFEYEATTKFK